MSAHRACRLGGLLHGIELVAHAAVVVQPALLSLLDIGPGSDLRRTA